MFTPAQEVLKKLSDEFTVEERGMLTDDVLRQLNALAKAFGDKFTVNDAMNALVRWEIAIQKIRERLSELANQQH